MRLVPLATLLFFGLQLSACEQNGSKRSKIEKPGIKADEETVTTKNTKKKTTEETSSTTSGVPFCDEGLDLVGLNLDPQSKNLMIDGAAKSLCQIIKSSSKKVFLFQLVSTSCSDCATKVLRTGNYLGLSSYLPHIEYVLLFTDKAPSEGDVTNITISQTIIPAFDSKGEFGGEFSANPQSDGSEFLIISSKGDVETHTDEKYLEAISKAETLAKKADQNLSETIPDLLKASRVEWDGSTIKHNKRFSLSATE